MGTYLVPRLVLEGHEVISVCRNQRKPYHSHSAWKSVKQIQIDRIEAEKSNSFGEQISILNPDVVIDMICFTPESAVKLVEALYGKVKHFIHCGTIWVHGYSTQVPAKESQFKAPFGEYGINKAAIESYLITQYKENGFPVTILHPGHIVGPGWNPVNPAGNFNPDVFQKLAAGEEVLIPNFGMETLHHVHADDVAQSFVNAVNNASQATGESFHVTSSRAITLRGYADAIAEWFGKEPKLRFLPWQEWKKTVNESDSNSTWDHIAHSPTCSIDKARKLLNFNPVYSSLDAVKESLTSLINNKKLF